MFGQAHIIDVGFLRAGVRKLHRIVPEPEAIDRTFTFCHGKEGFAVSTFHARNQVIFPVNFQCAGVKCGVYAMAL